MSLFSLCRLAQLGSRTSRSVAQQNNPTPLDHNNEKTNDFLLGLPLTLSGCLTAEELAAQRAEFKAQVAAADDSECRSYGAEQGTPVYVECRMIKDERRAQETAAAQAENNRQFHCNLGLMASGFGTAEQQDNKRGALAASGC
jgi:hypothetical protein